MRFISLSSFALATTFLLASPNAYAGARTGVYPVDDTLTSVNGQPSNNIIFMNACRGGCNIIGGFDDSTQNTSSIVYSTLGSGAVANITEFMHSQEDWDATVACVKSVYEPFNITVTDVDPGPNVSHYEAIVAGIDDEINYEADGVAPGSGCGDYIHNAITFTFANQVSLSNMCWVVAQETAHVFGLDHVMTCEDPMTYRTDCDSYKTFQNMDSQCGETEERSCKCTNTQNSFQQLMGLFGPGALEAPEVAINRPADGATVRPNFPIEIMATDNFRVESVEFLINGEVFSTLNAIPYVMNAPDNLTGDVRIEARATDNLGSTTTSTIINVTIDDTPPAPLADFGGSCTTNEECISSLCVVGEDGGSCSEVCDLSAAEDTCPAQSSCLAVGETSICWAQSSSTGGCSASRQSMRSGGLGLGLLLMLGFFAWRRRRSV